MGILKPKQDKRCDDDSANAVAEPPGNPDGRVMRPICESSHNKSYGANRGADRGTNHAGEENESEDVL